MKVACIMIMKRSSLSHKLYSQEEVMLICYLKDHSNSLMSNWWSLWLAEVKLPWMMI